MDIPHWKCSKKLQRKKTITTIEIHYSAKLQNENMKTSGNKVKVCMIRAHKIILEQTNDFHWKRTMANHSRKLAQNHVAAPLPWEGIESNYGPSGQECYRGGPAHKHPTSIFPAK